MQRLIVHPADHQHLPAVVLLNDRTDQPGRVTFELIGDLGSQLRHAPILPDGCAGAAPNPYGRQNGTVTDSLAARERAGLADALAAAGPDASTLCQGWTTRDLAAHLVLREGRADVGLVLGADLLPALRPYADQVMARVAARPYDDLVAAFRNGPPRVSAFALPGVDRLANTTEHVVHHEDVRRARPDWQPRTFQAADADDLWRAATVVAGRRFSKSPVGVVLRSGERRHRAKAGLPAVVLSGQTCELLLVVFGRHRHARFDIDGAPEVVSRFRAWFG
jgi:uncharacterized protein (TIGR03085 family)